MRPDPREGIRVCYCTPDQKLTSLEIIGHMVDSAIVILLYDHAKLPSKCLCLYL